MIVEIAGKPIEIQVRSSLQHLWAEFSEKSSDVLDPTIKYGGGTDSWRHFLTSSSESVASYEAFETTYSEAAAVKEVADAAHETFKKAVAELPEHDVPDREAEELRRKLDESARKLEIREQEDQEMRRELVYLWKVNADLLTGAVARLDKLKGQKP